MPIPTALRTALAAGLLLLAPAVHAAPAAGAWEGGITNRFVGHQFIAFRVAEDGRSVEEVAFRGYWDCRTAGLTTLEHLDPPGVFEIAADGTFGDVRRHEAAAMWWEVRGRFHPDGTATGSIRVAYAGTECDSYKLEWTARPAS